VIDLLVISHACFKAINRSIYQLFLQDGWKVELVAPVTLSFPAGIKEADPPGPGDPPIHYLPLLGDNPRTYVFDGLFELLDVKKPRIVLLDNDPVSRMAVRTGKWCMKNASAVFCISNENLSPGIVATMQRRGVKTLPASFVKRYLLMQSKKVVSGVFAINEDGRKLFLKEGYKRVMHMPLGFDPRFFYIDNQKRKQLRQQLQLQHPAIAYFGRLVPEKGVALLVKALQQLQQYQWHLLMDDFDVYASDYTKEIHQLLETSGIMQRVVFINPSHFEIGGYMNAADIVVVPSIAAPHWKEQYGRVAAEAMGCGRLVVASNSGALPELLDKYGILFPEGNTVLLQQQLEKLLINADYAAHFPPEQTAHYAKTSLSIQRQKEIMEQAFNA
jgi:glycosyltransferase involved in cell wall biosynthesis